MKSVLVLFSLMAMSSSYAGSPALLCDQNPQCPTPTPAPTPQQQQQQQQQTQNPCEPVMVACWDAGYAGWMAVHCVDDVLSGTSDVWVTDARKLSCEQYRTYYPSEYDAWKTSVNSF